MVSDLLPIQSINDVDVVDSRLIAIELGIKHESLMKTIKTFMERLERRGCVGFKIRDVEMPNGGTSSRLEHYWLNERHCIFLSTLSRNTEQAVELKDKIEESFYQAKQALKKPSDLSRKDILLMALEAEEEKLRFQAEVEHQKLLVAQKELKIQEQENVITVQGVQLMEWHPLVKNYKQFLDCDGLISFSQAGKMFNSGRNRVIKVLRLYGFLLQDKPEPYQKWMKFFKMRVKVRPHPTKSGEYKQDVVALFTPDGFNKIIKIMESKAGSQERLLEFIQSPSKLEALILQLKEGKRDDAITAIEDALHEEEMSIRDHMEESIRLGFYKPSKD